MAKIKEEDPLAHLMDTVLAMSGALNLGDVPSSPALSIPMGDEKKEEISGNPSHEHSTVKKDPICLDRPTWVAVVTLCQLLCPEDFTGLEPAMTIGTFSPASGLIQSSADILVKMIETIWGEGASLVVPIVTTAGEHLDPDLAGYGIGIKPFMNLPIETRLVPVSSTSSFERAVGQVKSTYKSLSPVQVIAAGRSLVKSIQTGAPDPDVQDVFALPPAIRRTRRGSPPHYGRGRNRSSRRSGTHDRGHRNKSRPRNHSTSSSKSSKLVRRHRSRSVAMRYKGVEYPVGLFGKIGRMLFSS